MKFICLSIFVYSLMTTSAFAGRPMVTDDVGTQGKGRQQLEASISLSYDRNNVDELTTIKTESGEPAITYTLGLVDTVDIGLGMPYVWQTVYENDNRVQSEKGISDITVDAKWRYFEKDGWALAIKPGLKLPTGNEAKGLGTGSTGYRAFIIGTKEFAQAAAHVNIGYIRNENEIGARKDIWHLSAAIEYELIESLKVVADIGIQRNSAPDSNNHPAFVLGGLTYRVSGKATLDAAVKYGVTSPETDLMFTAGVTIKF